jgi:PAS domain S-box-containing protein
MARATKPPKAAAARFAAITALPEPALITLDRWEKGGVEILAVNPAFCRLTGYSAEELIGQNTRLLHGTKTDFALLQHGRRDTPAGNPNTGEGWLCRKDGTPFFARWNFSPLTGPGEPAGRLIALYHDQSEVKRLREALLQSQKLDTVGLLASGVAHDFNNLLSIINGYCEILSGKITRVPEAQKDLNEIHRAGLKAAAIARQILEFSRRQETEVRVVNYNTLIREIAEILRRVAGDDVVLELRLASDLGNARVDPTQFQQVLLNLCFNAREAMPRGGKLTIRTYNHRVTSPADARLPEMKPGLYAVMRVTDSGGGLVTGTLDKIFEPFFTTKPQGTGLGLATVLSIIRQHDGHVTVQSTPGVGTTFEVFLRETPEPEQTAPVTLTSLPATRGTETLLIIEEDEVLRKMIGGIMAADGYRVTDVATAEAATAVIDTPGFKPQLVLANCEAKAVAQVVRALHRKIPTLRLISISAGLPAGLRPEFSAKAFAHLPKPFALSTLMRSVRTLLDAGGR